jgi:hypothetical protein
VSWRRQWFPDFHRFANSLKRSELDAYYVIEGWKHTEPEEWEEHEHSASVDSSRDLSNELLIPRDRCWDIFTVEAYCEPSEREIREESIKLTRLGWLPKVGLATIPHGLDRVDRPGGDESESDNAKGLRTVSCSLLTRKNSTLTSSKIDPRGGVTTYCFLPSQRTMGTIKKIPVGTSQAIQKPWSRARKEAEMAPVAPKLIEA